MKLLNILLLVAPTTLASVIFEDREAAFTKALDAELSLKSAWCNVQRYTCKNLCSKLGLAIKDPETGNVEPLINTCNPLDLTYDCVCVADYKVPLDDYAGTLPQQVCLHNLKLCTIECANVTFCIENCHKKFDCNGNDFFLKSYIRKDRQHRFN